MGVDIEVKNVQAVNANMLPVASGFSFILLVLENGLISQAPLSSIDNILEINNRVFSNRVVSAQTDGKKLHLNDEILKNGTLVTAASSIDGIVYEGSADMCHISVLFDSSDDGTFKVDGLSVYMNDDKLTAGVRYVADITIVQSKFAIIRLLPMKVIK